MVRKEKVGGGRRQSKKTSLSPFLFREGPGGPIRTDFGSYEKGTPDWNDGPTPSMLILDDNDLCYCYEAALAKIFHDIGQAGVQYGPLTTNSNAVVSSALRKGGFNAGRPPVWAPGWGTPLP